MIYWDPHRATECREQAEGLAHHGDRYDIHWGYLYRFENHGDRITLTAYSVSKKTQNGWVIRCRSGCRNWRFVSNSSRKRFALPSIDEAIESFVARKHKQASIYEAKAARARELILYIQNGGII